MATIYGAILGIKLLSESVEGGTGSVAEVTFELPAYTASADNGQLGGGGYDRGAANTASLATMIQNQRRDGKTVTLGNPAATTVSAGLCAESGKQGATEFWAGTFTISAGNLLFNVANTSGTEVDAAAGIYDRPLKVLVSYRVA